MKRLIILLFSILSILSATAQDRCDNLLDPAYISDGQSHKFTFSQTAPSKLYITFIEGFTYQMATCSDKSAKYEIKIFDTQRKLVFTGICDNYVKRWVLRFKSSVSCIVEIQELDNKIEGSQLKVLIGFK